MVSSVDKLSELNVFHGELVAYLSDSLALAAGKLQKKQLVEMNNLRTALLKKAGSLRWLIKELTGREMLTDTFPGGQQSSYDMWSAALRFPPNPRSRSALSSSIDVTLQAIGKLESDIEMGTRDRSGKMIAGRETVAPKGFISHGKESVALNKLEKFLRALGVEPIIVRDQPNLDRTVDKKVDHCLGEAHFVIILATGDDEIEGKLQPRQNVSHEIGLAQKTHAGKIIYLLEDETEFSSNISPKTWERFKQENMENVFERIIVELKALQILTCQAQ